ncbi:MAG: glutathione S-transferase [Hydrogenophaga sp.]|uniref:glutathione S-transferase family protein n=1 Tax=Hydrogenophaga sp. TaxID=1904254 RepID=UPI002724A3D5|nr:glutathione S-transferase [Hydrogenophaga sp.]MDO9480656.1 glutathione S-transferase [Hydrogenophaga sp.]MDP3343185.1 glutathione S-transferase [Hydrogenophaga sp.]MDP3809245.1 glutathione S-transferase [Hydrogenophaga sp.]MDP3922541.1 glutathione S-transferase [Hydrogenophaga sp.]
MKLYYGPTSPFVRKVRIFAMEAGLDSRIELQRTPVGMLRPNALVLGDNPLGKVPTLILEDGPPLFESDLICDYLDTLHNGPRLIPTEGPARWQALRWNAAASGALSTLVLWHNERLRSNVQRSTFLIDVFALKTRTTLEWMTRELDSLTRKPFGIGHISVGCFLGYLSFRMPGDFPWRDDFPALALWESDFEERASARLTRPAPDSMSSVPPTSTTDSLSNLSGEPTQ